ncbi:MAG TPA: glycosyltransferase family 1 protein [Sumerlaeia bacterium]|nr:glycosyltransferase family 1 protein [Sumerlaeia bacterium]
MTSFQGNAAPSGSPDTLRVALDVRVLQGEDARRGIGHYTRGLTETLLRRAACAQPGAAVPHSNENALEPRFEYVLVADKRLPPPDLDAPGALDVVSISSPVAPGSWLARLRGAIDKALAGTTIPRDAAALARAAGRRRAHVLHIHSPLHGPFNWTPRRPAPLVATVYDLIPALHPGEFLERWPPAARRRYEERLQSLASCSALLAISKSVARDLTEFAAVEPDRIAVAYPGVRGELRNLLVAARHEREDYILSFASRNPSKNTDRFLEGYALMAKEGAARPPLRLIGPDDAELREWVRVRTLELGIAGEVRFLGRVSDGQLAELYRRAALLVLPSLAEGFGLPALEAMACGTPVAASDVPVLREVIGDAGVFFDPRRPDDMGDCLAGIVHDADRLALLSRKASQRVQSFSWEKTAEAAEGVYRRVCLSGGGARAGPRDLTGRRQTCKKVE